MKIFDILTRLQLNMVKQKGVPAVIFEQQFGDGGDA
jgi:hypothetical protein